jgi:ABC-2 type transport system ATP-binding protein
MSEMEQTADHLVVIGAGRLLAATAMRAFINDHSPSRTVVRSPQLERLLPRLRSLGAAATPTLADTVEVASMAPERIGEIAAELGVTLHELRARGESLEEVYTRMTSQSVEYHSGQSRSNRA